jgi:hypothetical protein
MTPQSRTSLLEHLNDFSLLLAVASGLPYTMGDAADILPPTVKKYVTLVAVSAAALTKLTQVAIKVISSFNVPGSPPANPLMANPSFAGPQKP